MFALWIIGLRINLHSDNGRSTISVARVKVWSASYVSLVDLERLPTSILSLFCDIYKYVPWPVLLPIFMFISKVLSVSFGIGHADMHVSEAFKGVSPARPD